MIPTRNVARASARQRARDRERLTIVPTPHRIRRVTAGFTLTAILGIVLAACGSAAGTAAPSTPPNAAPTAAPATPTPAAPSAAASPAASATASAALAGPQTGRIELADKGFAVTLPDGWTSLPVDPASLQAVIDSLPDGSEMKSMLQSQVGNAALQTMAFWAFDTRPEHAAGGTTRNMNVIVQPPSTFDLSLVESTLKAQLGTIDGIGTIESKIMTLPAGKALRLDYPLAIPGADGTTKPVATTQYYVQMPKATLIVSFTSEADAPDAAADFDAIIGSIESL